MTDHPICQQSMVLFINTYHIMIGKKMAWLEQFRKGITRFAAYL